MDVHVTPKPNFAQMMQDTFTNIVSEVHDFIDMSKYGSIATSFQIYDVNNYMTIFLLIKGPIQYKGCVQLISRTSVPLVQFSVTTSYDSETEILTFLPDRISNLEKLYPGFKSMIDYRNIKHPTTSISEFLDTINDFIWDTSHEWSISECLAFKQDE